MTKYEFFSFPTKLEYSDYEEAINKLISKISEFGQIKSIYQVGSITDLGISDIDVIIVIDKDKINTDKINEFWQNFNANDSFRKTIFHPPLCIVTPQLFRNIHSLFPLFNYKKIFGEEITNIKPSDPIKKLILNVDISLIFTYELMEAFLTKKIDVRLTLLKLNAIRHSINFLFEISGKKENDFEKYASEYRTFRNNWFNYSEIKQKQLLSEFLEKGINIYFEVLSRFRDLLIQNNLIKKGDIHKKFTGIYNGNIFFINDWNKDESIKKSLETFNELEIITVYLPSEFVGGLYCYLQSDSELATYLKNKIILHINSNLINKNLYNTRVESLQSHFSFLRKNNLFVGTVSPFHFEEYDSEIDHSWIKFAKFIFELRAKDTKLFKINAFMEKFIPILSELKIAEVNKKNATKLTKAILEVETLQKTNLENQQSIQEASDAIKQLSSEKTSLIEQINTLQKINVENQKIIHNTDPTITNSMIASFHSSIKEKDSQIANLHSPIKEKDSQIASLQQAIATYQKIIIDIHQSFVLRMLHKYDNTLGKIIPLRPKKYLKSSQEHLTDEEQASNTKKALELKIEKKDILCFPIINWDYRYQRPQHIMSEFAKNGHRVFYLTVNLKKLTRPYEIKPISNNIFQVELRSPKFFDIYKDKFDKSLTENILKSFESFQQDLRLDAISFVQFPTWEPLVTELKKRFDYKIVFDCLDDFTGFGNVVKERKGEEATLIKNADLVTATASSLIKKIMKNTSKSLFLPNAGEFAHFNKQSSDKLLRDYEKPIVGYFGSIAEWFNNDLIEFVAQKRPHLTFVFIGYTFGSDIRKLSELKNVHFLGERPYSELPKYLQDFDVCLIPFKDIPLIQATHPVKIYEYFSAGKPVVTTNIPELFSMRDLCYISENKEDFLAKLDLALKENDAELKRKRIEFASKNTWEHRFQKLYAQLNEIPSLNLAEHK